MSDHTKSKSYHVVTVVGARPQFVKAAALSPCLRATGIIEESIVHTGQHFDPSMSDIFFEEMNIPCPKLNLGIGGGTHGQNTGRMIEALEKVLITSRPDAVVVYGDTDSTLATAIAASKLGLRLVHIEAGLRSFKRSMPEEINRVLTDHVSDLLYAPSQRAVDLLSMEGIHGEKVVNAGDVMLDVVKRFVLISKEHSQVLDRLNLNSNNYQLLTMHRKENVDNPTILQSVLYAIGDSAIPTIFLAHPRTAKIISEFKIQIPKMIRLINPVGYIDMIRLIQDCRLVLTDSGGLQKEAYFLDKPCITLRDETEWTELVDAGVNVLAGTDPRRIASALECLKFKISVSTGIYGDGHAAEKIALDLLTRLKQED